MFTAKAFCGSDGIQRTGAQWATAYADAACGCATQSCFNDLQDQLVDALGCVSYDDGRDGVTYDRQLERAVQCVSAAPNQ